MASGKMAPGAKLVIRRDAKCVIAPPQVAPAGIARVTEDRKLDGLVDMTSVLENIGLRGWRSSRETRLLRRSRRCVRSTSLGPSRQRRPEGALPLRSQPAEGRICEVFGAKPRAEIRQVIRAFADSGAGVMLISLCLPEILDLSDRILVAKGGAIAAELARSEAIAEKILDAAIR